MRKEIILICLGLLVLTLGCTQTKSTSFEPTSAADLLTVDEKYEIHDLSTETADAISYSAASAVGLLGAPEFSLPVQNRVKAFVSCLKESGVYAVRGYIDKQDPMSVGIMGVGEEDQDKILQCLVTSMIPLQSAIQPKSYGLCAASYKITTPAKKDYYITFLGTSSSICSDLCDNSKINCDYDKDVAKVWVYED